MAINFVGMGLDAIKHSAGAPQTLAALMAAGRIYKVDCLTGGWLPEDVWNKINAHGKNWFQYAGRCLLVLE